jgi:hypothetical protein
VARQCDACPGNYALVLTQVTSGRPLDSDAVRSGLTALVRLVYSNPYVGLLPLSGCQLAGLISSSGGLKCTDPWEREAGGPWSLDVGRSLELDIVD